MAKNNRTKMLMGEWRASSSLAGVYALRMLGMFLVLPVLALHAASMPGAQNKEAWIGLAMGIYGLTQAILQLPLGMASDRYGRKKVIYLGLIVFAGGSFMAAAATSLEMLVIARAIQGAGGHQQRHQPNERSGDEHRCVIAPAISEFLLICSSPATAR